MKGTDTLKTLDLMVKPEDAGEALNVLVRHGMRPERPPEGWLYKAWDENGVMVDLIFRPWDDVRARTVESPYAAAFFTLVEGLGIVEPPSGG